MSEWTEGICGDGAAILRDGVQVSIIDLLAILNGMESALAAEREACAKLADAEARIYDSDSDLGAASCLRIAAAIRSRKDET